MIKMTANSMTFTVEDESGYHFIVDAAHDPEFGWTATVTVACRGMITAESAVDGLAAPAKHFLRMLSEAHSAPTKE